VITVVKAPIVATVQDFGRAGHRALGVPPSGAMDRDALVATNVCVGNAPGAAALEIALGGGELRFETASVIATGGARLLGMLGDRSVEPWVPVPVQPGDVLRIDRIVEGQFSYLAVHGGIDVPVVLGSRSTLMSAQLGGFQGRRLAHGDVLRLGDDIVGGPGPVPPVLHDDGAGIPLTPGPQAAQFSDEAWATLLGCTFGVSRFSNRMGYRFEGVAITHDIPTDRPSEPTCIGAIQVPSGGTPIVLMNDGPTVGGYPKIAVVREDALGMLAQRAPGAPVRFVLDG
jgi:biotin-dependent carboxylase-like uncharacterized protein